MVEKFVFPRGCRAKDAAAALESLRRGVALA
ncbi:hypothetical protein BJ956_002932 [Arthrobacter psychrochitiniphilus]|nr:hypothetical protein [Arthrobacter psychrochitiniphilus]